MSELDVRDDFPLLKRHIAGKPIVYLDSAATALKPTVVLDAEHRYATYYTANVHRGLNLLSEEATNAFEAARQTVGRFLQIESRQVVWVRSATEGINLVASGLRLEPSDTILVPITEHHSNQLPWMRAGRIVWLDHEVCEPIGVDQTVRAIEATAPKLLAISAASNVTGVVNPVVEICLAARKLGVLTLVDASQAIPHFAVDQEKLAAACDYLVFSGHKMLGPTGIGVLAGRAEALDRLEPLMLGGGAVEQVTLSGYTLRAVPARLEAGTPNISGALGLAAAVNYLVELGPERVRQHEQQIAKILFETLSGITNGIVLMTPKRQQLALGSLAFKDARLSNYLATALSDAYGIMVRSGFHCAHPLFDRIGLGGGAVRFSSYVYNTAEEIEFLHRCLCRILGS